MEYLKPLYSPCCNKPELAQLLYRSKWYSICSGCNNARSKERVVNLKLLLLEGDND